MKRFKDFNKSEELEESTLAPIKTNSGYKAEIKADRNPGGGTELVLTIDPIEIETWSRTLDTSGADQTMIVKKTSKEIEKELERTISKFKKIMDKALEK